MEEKYLDTTTMEVRPGTCLLCSQPAEGLICSTCLMQQMRQVLGETVCRRLGIIELPPGLKLSVVVPVYNERDTLRQILKRIMVVRIPKEIILIDDFSKDGTREILQEIEQEQMLPGTFVKNIRIKPCIKEGSSFKQNGHSPV